MVIEMIKYGAFSEVTGDKPIKVCDDIGDAMDFCYSQNKNIYPKEVMTISPIYCFIRKVEVNDRGDIISIDGIIRNKGVVMNKQNEVLVS